MGKICGLDPAQATLEWGKYINREEWINDKIGHLSTDVSTEFDKQKTVYIKNLT
jgi:hypothetical protein